MFFVEGEFVEFGYFVLLEGLVEVWIEFIFVVILIILFIMGYFVLFIRVLFFREILLKMVLSILGYLYRYIYFGYFFEEVCYNGFFY